MLSVLISESISFEVKIKMKTGCYIRKSTLFTVYLARIEKAIERLVLLSLQSELSFSSNLITICTQAMENFLKWPLNIIFWQYKFPLWKYIFIFLSEFFLMKSTSFEDKSYHNSQQKMHALLLSILLRKRKKIFCSLGSIHVL